MNGNVFHIDVAHFTTYNVVKGNSDIGVFANNILKINISEFRHIFTRLGRVVGRFAGISEGQANSTHSLLQSEIFIFYILNYTASAVLSFNPYTVNVVFKIAIVCKYITHRA